MAAAARNSDSLTPDQCAKATFEFNSDERPNWHFVPKGPEGLTLKDMTEEQRKLAKALLASGSRARPLRKAETIMCLDRSCKRIEQGKGPVRDPELYYFPSSATPTPSKAPWGWRFEGHHLSLNFTDRRRQGRRRRPRLPRHQPRRGQSGPRKGLRVLGEEEDLGRALVKSLDHPADERPDRHDGPEGHHHQRSARPSLAQVRGHALLRT